MPEDTAPTMPNQRPQFTLSVPMAIVIGAAIIGVCLIIGLSHFGSAGTAAATTTAPSGATQTVNIQNVKTAGEPYIGNVNAPVTMAFWSDWQCPYCKAWETGGVSEIPGAAVLPQIVQQYVDTGKLKIVFKDFQFLGQDSIDDGEYARAIWALYPSQYFTWRTAMYTQQPEENSLSESANKTHVEQVTESISGIDLAKVEANIAANKSTYDAAMQADETEGESFGIDGTPGFIIGTTLVSGDEPLASFTAPINALLK